MATAAKACRPVSETRFEPSRLTAKTPWPTPPGSTGGHGGLWWMVVGGDHRRAVGGDVQSGDAAAAPRVSIHLFRRPGAIGIEEIDVGHVGGSVAQRAERGALAAGAQNRALDRRVAGT